MSIIKTCDDNTCMYVWREYQIRNLTFWIQVARHWATWRGELTSTADELGGSKVSSSPEEEEEEEDDETSRAGRSAPDLWVLWDKTLLSLPSFPSSGVISRVGTFTTTDDEGDDKEAPSLPLITLPKLMATIRSDTIPSWIFFCSIFSLCFWWPQEINSTERAIRYCPQLSSGLVLYFVVRHKMILFRSDQLLLPIYSLLVMIVLGTHTYINTYGLLPPPFYYRALLCFTWNLGRISSFLLLCFSCIL